MELSRADDLGPAEFFSRPTSNKFIFSISRLDRNQDCYEPCQLFVASRAANGHTQYRVRKTWESAGRYVRHGKESGNYIAFTTEQNGEGEPQDLIEFDQKNPEVVPAYLTTGIKNWTVQRNGSDVMLEMLPGHWELSFWLQVKDHSTGDTKIFVGDPITCTSGGKCY